MLLVALVATAAACGDDGPPPPTCPGPFEVGTDGHAAPLGASATEARAGRLAAIPDDPQSLATWRAGDFVLANDKVAIVIEDVGDSDQYDPWGGKPVGIARVANGALVEPTNFGEFFIMTGRSTVIADSVSVIADGTDGGPAIVRARGKLHPVPFLENLLGAVFSDPYDDIDATIDYELAPGAEVVTIRMRYASARDEAKRQPTVLNALMYTKRTPVFQPTKGFDDALDQSYVALVDEGRTSWAYLPEGAFGGSIAASGFVGAFTPGFDMPACGTLDRVHARIVIGGPGTDGIVAAVARTRGDATRVITGTVATPEAGGFHVHAVDAASTTYYSRATTDATGAFSITVPEAANVKLVAFRRGDAMGEATVGTATTSTITVPAHGNVQVTVNENGLPSPARVQLRPAAGQMVAKPPKHFGEVEFPGDRLWVDYTLDGNLTLPAPPGAWDVIVSRGYEYDLVEDTVTVAAGATVARIATLERVVDSTGIQCGDFHVHTSRSNDSNDSGIAKVTQAIADGVELPVRSDHEWVGDFAWEIDELGMQAHAAGFGSIELTSMELWGHMGVFPLSADPTRPNMGAPAWQTYPTAAAPETPFETLRPPAVFDAVRARPEAPVVIINHPRGGTNYFGYVGYDPATGTADQLEDWDTKFTLVEVFNDSGWQANKDGNVADWMGLLRAGRKVFAVGSSDSHGLVGSPVGYPRTCVRVGTDDPRMLTASQVRDELAAGHGAISGGILVDARLGTTRTGDQTTGAGAPMMLDVTVQAPTWVDVDSLDVVVDGVVVDTIPIMASDADPGNPVIRFARAVPVQTAAAGGFVLVAAYGSSDLEPVHPGRKPFGVTEPIFVRP